MTHNVSRNALSCYKPSYYENYEKDETYFSSLLYLNVLFNLHTYVIWYFAGNNESYCEY